MSKHADVRHLYYLTEYIHLYAEMHSAIVYVTLYLLLYILCISSNLFIYYDQHIYISADLEIFYIHICIRRCSHTLVYHPKKKVVIWTMYTYIYMYCT